MWYIQVIPGAKISFHECENRMQHDTYNLKVKIVTPKPEFSKLKNILFPALSFYMCLFVFVTSNQMFVTNVYIFYVEL